MKKLLVVCLLLAGALAARAAESESALVARAQAALQAKDWPKAEGLYRELAAIAPANWTYPQGLADAQGMQAKYADAVAAYDKAVAMALAAKDDKARWAAGAMLTAEGNVYLKLKKPADAMATYRKAAGYAQNPATAWFNLCAVAYNMGDVAAALDGCDKAIAADPNKADAWFIKGSLMVADSKAGPNGKMIPPKGTIEALRKYLALAPNGSHVKDVKEMLAAVQ
jgi:tetratricopeptide (TPR) repeat protein